MSLLEENTMLVVCYWDMIWGVTASLLAFECGSDKEAIVVSHLGQLELKVYGGKPAFLQDEILALLCDFLGPKKLMAFGESDNWPL